MNSLTVGLERQRPDTTGVLPSRARGRILVVEDDAGIAAEVVAELSNAGYEVVHCDNAPAAIQAAGEKTFSLLIMDRMLPGMDGLTAIGRLRQEKIPTPVLVLSALSAVDDRVRGLKAGGDDYLTKPFALQELSARVEALLRRPQDVRDMTLVVGDVELDLIERIAIRRGVPIELLPREFKLLQYLMRRPGQVVTRAMLLEDVWHYRFVPHTNLVDVHVGKLRRKIDLPDEPSLIESVRGSGFMFREAA
jgi:two-component system OmpR family response regulator